MVDSFTDNRNIIQPLVGGDSGTWGGLLNSGVAAQLDLILGATQALSITGADVNVTIPQWNNCAIKLTGVLTGNQSLILPLNANSATVAVGGLFVVDNQTTGAFNVTVKTIASGSTGVTVPQGKRTFLYSDTVNVVNADDAKLQLIPFSGNPNGSVAGTAGAVNVPPSMVWDYTNNVLYVCTTTGVAAAAVWTNLVQNILGTVLPVPQPEGYLTPTSNTPIILSDVISATALYYTPFTGTWAAIHNGTSIIPYQFSQMQLTLTTSQAANNIYDIFLAYNSNSPVIGTGPSWAAGGGSVTAGSCARGTGAGSTDISRASPSGLWVNTNSMSLIYNTGSGNTTITVGAGQGIYLGSLYIDSVAGQVTCHRSYGQNRKWGIFNAYNRVPVYLKAGDSTATWLYSVNTWRAANGASANSLTVFSALPEEVYDFWYEQDLAGNNQNAGAQIGVGFNSTTAPVGKVGAIWQSTTSSSLSFNALARYRAAPSLGINTITGLETGINGVSVLFQGTETFMLLSATWRA